MGQRVSLMAYSGAPSFNRKALATQAMQASITARLKAQYDLVSPVSICDVAEKLGVRVTFNDINMEGMYQRGRPPRIHLSALRPLVRRTYNCGHELGHHELGHGSSIDELREDQATKPWDDPNEFMADAFAGFTLMPTLGLRHAFVVRGWDPESVTPSQLYRIASHFGVGYTSLITHLHYGVGIISRARLITLQKAKPSALRAEILGSITPAPLLAIDAWSTTTIIDAEVKHLLLMPHDTVAEGAALKELSEGGAGRLFEACRPGIARVTRRGGEWAAFVRVSRTAYVGRAEFRHLEDDSDE
jgi:Zn-dependent peptidase ImmA (M78 family)